MPDLKFEIMGAEPMSFAVAPHLAFKLSIVDRAAERHTINSIVLRCQIRLEPTKRSYDKRERERLFELFGEPRDWGRTVHSLLWTHITLNVPAFYQTTTIDLPVPCTYDFNVAATKYFDGLENGEVPLCFLFSGTVFYQDSDGILRITQVSWEEEASFRLPVKVWRGLMEQYYPNTVWLGIPKDLYERMNEFKRRHALMNWEQALERSLSNHLSEVESESFNR